ncbi:phosphoglycerate mutase-like protein [Schizopora paradoxa]|uniref:Phytase A n=1 Tax=Schizopora paradoxa TaxID=27342 RepID=A0A0H2R3L3_9AGAM|nr:phosphoglycerate mutase-like protein [Schizopora paradoxa]
MSMADFDNDSESQPFIHKSVPTENFHQSRADASSNENDQKRGHLLWNRRRSWTTVYGPSRPVILLLLAFCAILVLRTLLRLIPQIDWNCRDGKHKYHPTTPTLGVPEDVQHNWAQYSPYHPEGVYLTPPDGCVIDQVNILQRHGARYPTEGAGINIKHAVQKLQNADEFRDERLNFLKHYSYDLGYEGLVHFGAAQSFDSGQEHFQRYEKLLNNSTLPFVRASGSARVIESAEEWISGVSFASHYKHNLSLNVIIPETDNSNNTLDDDMCPNAGDSEPFKSVWQNIFSQSILNRLNAIAPGSGLESADIPHLMSLCSFDTIAKEERSPFCSLFNSTEFEDYEYFHDLDKYYKTGYGQRLGPVQGVGYVNELLARLTDTPVRDNTQTNRTLDASPDTFPLERPFYIDFSHDNEMVAIYAAMGLFRQETPLNLTMPEKNRTWRAAKLVPFSSRMVAERLSCGGETFVRVFVNDAIQPLEFCDAKSDGLCNLRNFVHSQSYARNDGEGDFEKCYS